MSDINQDMVLPGYSQEAANISRRQRIADMLRQMSLANNGGTDMVGGWAIPKSPMEGIAKLFQGYQAGKIDKEENAALADLSKRYGTAQQQAYAKLLSMGDQSSPAAGAAATNVGQYLDGTAGGNPPPADVGASIKSNQNPVNKVSQLKSQAMAAFLAGDKDLANKLTENALTLTNDTKREGELGIGQADARMLEMARRNKEGTMSLQPNQTNIMPNGQRFVAADFGQGTHGGYDQQGNPQMGVIPGAQGAIGAINFAKELPKAQLTPFTVNSQQGPMLTNQAAAAGFGNNPPIPLQTEQAQKFANLRAEDAAKSISGLNDRIRSGSDLMSRIGESRDAMKNFTSGGGKETRADLAQTAQALGLPDKVVNGIAGGDLTSMQIFQKLATTQAMETLKQTMATDGGQAGRMTQAEFQQFLKVNPGLNTDTKAIEKLFSFSEYLHNLNLKEQESYDKYLQAGNDPVRWPVEWAKERAQYKFTPNQASPQQDIHAQADAILRGGK